MANENKMKIAQQIIRKIKTNKKKLSEISLALSTMKDGNIVIKHRNNVTRFFQSINGCKKYLNKNDKTIIISLARKKYYTKLQAGLIEQNKNLEKALKYIARAENEPTAEEIYNSLPEEIKELVNIDELDNNFATQWQAITYKRKKVPEELPFYTAKNEHVRSKSELIIANALKAHDIPYHYECPITLDEEPIHPDFTVLNKRTREIYIWEHFGRMDDKEYCIKTLNKIELYIANEFLLGKNLIFTYETSETPLNTQTVENKIAEFLK